MSTRFIHPITHEPLRAGPDGHLCDRFGHIVFESDNGSYDFVVDAPSREERAHYEEVYADGGWWGATTPLTAADLPGLWNIEPWSPAHLSSIGDVRGKNILLIGNGTSVKEFLFVVLGATVTFTDLSLGAVKHAKQRYQTSDLGAERPDGCKFHALNATHLPFDDNSFDIIVADAVIHHMDNLRALFAEFHRCLSPKGFCRFADTAYSSSWQGAKKGILRPLQTYAHKKQGISPEDQRATERGGYTRRELELLQKEVGFRALYYRRVAFFDYLLWRARCKLNAPWLLVCRRLLRKLDQALVGSLFMQRQGIALIFGFDK
jgi:ubiquinone/menaquinone biosynthesis C-methylase UbiE